MGEADAWRRAFPRVYFSMEPKVCIKEHRLKDMARKGELDTEVHQVFCSLPLDQILVETDAPMLQYNPLGAKSSVVITPKTLDCVRGRGVLDPVTRRGYHA